MVNVIMIIYRKREKRQMKQERMAGGCKRSFFVMDDRFAGPAARMQQFMTRIRILPDRQANS